MAKKENLNAINRFLNNFSKFANSIPRPFGVRYNAYTQSIEVLDSKHQISNLMNNINSEFQILQNAVEKLKI